MKRVTPFERWWRSLYERRGPVIALSAAVGSVALAVAFELPTSAPPWARWASVVLFVLATTITVSASTIPEHYERIRIVASLLPTIYEVLAFDPTARITLHHIYSRRREVYEQVTNYYPTRTGKGRRFGFTQAITGQAFRSRQANAYSIPSGLSMRDDYKRRWPFTDSEIGQLQQDRRSFFVFPIGQDGEYARAVLFCDSANERTFPESRLADLDAKMRQLFLPTLESILGVQNRQLPSNIRMNPLGDAKENL